MSYTGNTYTLTYSVLFTQNIMSQVKQYLCKEKNNHKRVAIIYALTLTRLLISLNFVLKFLPINKYLAPNRNMSWFIALKNTLTIRPLV